MRTLIRSAVLLVALASAAAAKPKAMACMTETSISIVADLKSSNLFASVDPVDCGAATPSLTTLKTYDAVLVTQDVFGNDFADATGLGNNLADYVDSGGLVVLAMSSMEKGRELTGKWSTGGYSCILPGTNPGASGGSKVAAKAMPNDPTSPIVQGVTGISAYDHSIGGLNSAKGAVSVWDHVDGTPLVCRVSINGHLRIDLNFHPDSFDYTDTKPGDGAKLVANALSGGGSAGPTIVMPSKTAVTFPDQAIGSPSMPQTLSYKNTSMAPVTLNALALSGTNSSDFTVTPATQLPVTIAVGQSANVSIVFLPTDAGPRSATLEAAVSGQMDTVKTPLSGNGIGPMVALAPSPLVLGGVLLGKPLMGKFSVTNAGGGTATINAISVTTDAASFTANPGFKPPFTLVPGATIDVAVTFMSMTAGAHAGVITVDSNVGKQTIAVSATTGDPQISIPNTTVVFPGQHVGVASAPSSFFITNKGNSNLNLKSIALGGADAAAFTIGKIPNAILPGQVGTYTITFKPSKVGQHKATVTIASDDPKSGMLSYDVLGSGVDFMEMVTPSSIDFGKVKGGQSATQNVTVTNGSPAVLTILAATLTGKDMAMFSLAGMPAFPMPIGSSKSAILGVTFKPTAAGTAAATLTLMLDDPKMPTATVALTGSATAGKLVVTPALVMFGSVPVNTQSAVQAVDLTNGGNDDVTISKIAITGAMKTPDFTITDTPNLPLKLMAGQKATLHLVYAPANPGAGVASLEVTSDDPLLPLAKVALSGSGAQPGINVDNMALDFGPVPVGIISEAKTVTIMNTGDAALKIDSVGAGDPQFLVDMHGPFIIKGGSMAPVSVRFQPSKTGMAAADLTITPSSASMLMPVTVSLTGTGVQLGVMVSPMALAFPATTVGKTSDPQTVTITNTSMAAIQLAAIAANDARFFKVDASKATLMLASGKSTTFTVTFAPTEAAAESTLIPIQLMGGGKQLGQVSVSGEGVAAKPADMSSGGCAVAARTAPGTLATLAALLLLGLALRRRGR